MKLITLHWTAGTHTATFPDYHFCVKGSGEVVRTLSPKVKGAHCWGRNTDNLGISMCAMADGFKPTPKQIEVTAKLVAEACLAYGINPHATLKLPAMKIQGDRLVATGATIEAPTIADHAYFAKKDGYYPDRWDIGDLYGPILNKARWYHEKLVAKQAAHEYTAHFH